MRGFCNGIAWKPSFVTILHGIIDCACALLNSVLCSVIVRLLGLNLLWVQTLTLFLSSFLLLSNIILIRIISQLYETGNRKQERNLHRLKIFCNDNNFFIIFLFFHQHHDEASTGARQLAAMFKYITITSSVSTNGKILEDKRFEHFYKEL